jgi:hypothetical protein
MPRTSRGLILRIAARSLSPAGSHPHVDHHAKGSFPMNSAPQVQTVEISDAELDTVSGGVSPQISVTVGSTTLSSADLLAEVDSVKATALGALGGTLAALPHNVGVNVGY